jgi:hypothetical protein
MAEIVLILLMVRSIRNVKPHVGRPSGGQAERDEPRDDPPQFGRGHDYLDTLKIRVGLVVKPLPGEPQVPRIRVDGDLAARALCICLSRFKS